MVKALIKIMKGRHSKFQAMFLAAIAQAIARMIPMMAKTRIHLNVSDSSSLFLLSSPIVKKITPAMKMTAE